MASASLLGDRFSALPELITSRCSSGERYWEGWVTILEVLRGTKRGWELGGGGPETISSVIEESSCVFGTVKPGPNYL